MNIAPTCWRPTTRFTLLPESRTAVHPDWLIPDWPAPANVHALCTTRAGGVSGAPYQSFNLGDHVGDDPAKVAANRTSLAAAMALRPVFLNQVHGVAVVELDRHTPDGTVADACLSAHAGLACCVMVADCLPVLFTTLQGQVVAAAHAGWRGLAGQGGVGILEATVQKICAAAQIQTSEKRAEIIAWLGPCIGPTVFEVGPEVYAAFVADQPQAQSYFSAMPAGKWLADLAGLARLRLRALGITQVYGNNSSAAWCTVGNASRFYSFRRDRVTGRQAASIWLV